MLASSSYGHRLNKIASLVRLDPREFEDAVLLRLALLVQSLPDLTPST
jgi:hypothetical protein